MNNNISIKKANSDILNELDSIGFDKAYISLAQNKYEGCTYKIFNLKPYEANILKQLCLSLGFDCAVSRDTVTCKCEFTNALIFASKSQLLKLIEKLKNQPFRLKQIAFELEKQFKTELEVLKIRNKIFDWTQPYIMGILNVTPDSFSDGGKYNQIDSALKHAMDLIQDGAHIIDIGGESTRPGAKNITPNEEISRVIPVISAIRKIDIEIPISIDTRNYETANAAIEAGADIINDVSGLDYDNKLFDFVVKNNIPVIIMHSDKVPAVSKDFTSSDIVEDVYFSLEKKILNLIEAGTERKNIIADTGIGFGKSCESNFELLRRMSEFTSLKVPILSGISRKSFIRNKFNIDFNDSDEVSALYCALQSSVNIHRVHNVKLTSKFLKYTRMFNNPQSYLQ